MSNPSQKQFCSDMSCFFSIFLSVSVSIFFCYKFHPEGTVGYYDLLRAALKSKPLLSCLQTTCRHVFTLIKVMIDLAKVHKTFTSEEIQNGPLQRDVWVMYY